MYIRENKYNDYILAIATIVSALAGIYEGYNSAGIGGAIVGFFIGGIVGVFVVSIILIIFYMIIENIENIIIWLFFLLILALIGGTWGVKAC